MLVLLQGFHAGSCQLPELEVRGHRSDGDLSKATCCVLTAINHYIIIIYKPLHVCHRGEIIHRSLQLQSQFIYLARIIIKNLFTKVCEWEKKSLENIFSPRGSNWPLWVCWPPWV